MAEYIDKRAAIADLNETYDKMSGFHPQFYNGYQVAVNRLRVFPAAEVVEPEVHGRWDDSGRYTFLSGDKAVRCSECGCALTESEYHLCVWNYCPVCGARMDGGADNG